MKIEILERTLDQQEEYDYRNKVVIKTEGLELSFHDGEQEDNCLSRNFQDVFGIKELVEKAHKAGREGKELLIVEKELEED